MVQCSQLTIGGQRTIAIVGQRAIHRWYVGNPDSPLTHPSRSISFRSQHKSLTEDKRSWMNGMKVTQQSTIENTDERKENH